MNGYRPLYATSWALVVGINGYQFASPLNFARQDAQAFAAILQERFGFDAGKISLLTDAAATRKEILSEFLKFTLNLIGPDDRIVVFFAGHGCTRSGKRGEVGFLVPVDGDPADLSTLIRWDELTRNAELVPAKHVLFLMDACYGGLAINRSTHPGSARFVRDMLTRYSRQVLTAGKADETVADSGGPRPDHSIFTGHLLDALEGKADDFNGIVSANAVMAYVYDKVAKDPQSRQSPHFGFFDGDGDFIFAAPKLTGPLSGSSHEEDFLVQVPVLAPSSANPSDIQTLVSTAKEYMADQRHRIRLDDLVGSEIKEATYQIREDKFPIQTAIVSNEDVLQRIQKYERVLSRLMSLAILLGRWGTAEHQSLIQRMVARLADGTEMRSGKVAWLGLRWYPTVLILYSGGIAALTSGNYQSLSTFLTTKVRGSTTGAKGKTAVESTVEGMLELDQMNLFKTLPGYENFYAPRSEHLFKNLQPQLEDLLFLGNGYEDDFDRFEIFYALCYLDLQTRLKGHMWAPPGRFAWKQQGDHSPFDSLVEAARGHSDEWEPLNAGFFQRSFERFDKLAVGFRDQVLSKLNWW